MKKRTMTRQAALVTPKMVPFLVLLAAGSAFAQPVFQESGGVVVVEAENFSARTGVGAQSWYRVPDEVAGSPFNFANFHGAGYIQALPNGFGGSSPLAPPLTQYQVRITTVGSYRLWVRWAATDNDADTFYASVAELKDGGGGSVADWYRYIRISQAGNFAASPVWFGSGGFERTDSPYSNGESPAVWDIASPGVYTIQLDMREDGAAIDAFVFQLASLPAPSGVGPPESATDLSITTDLRYLQLGEPVSLQLEASGGAPPYVWSVRSGVLPAGLGLDPSGLLSGTPTALGQSDFTIDVHHGGGGAATKGFTVEVTPVLPPPDIQIDLTTSTPVPGRDISMLAVVKNVGGEPANDVDLHAVLEPWYTFQSASPAAAAVDTFEDTFPAADGGTYDALITWSQLDLAPGEQRVYSYTAKLDNTFPVPAAVNPLLCANPGSGGGSGGSGCFSDCVTRNFTGLPTSIFGKVCLELLDNYCQCRCNGTRESFCDQENIIPIICGEFDYPRGQTSLQSSSAVAATVGAGGSCESQPFPSARPVDPNEKLVIAERYIQPDQRLVYPIHFENIGDVEARDVFVTDVLDDPGFDLSTLEILSPGGSFDPATQTLKWSLLNRDLLPGETDNVMLSIRPRADLPSGTAIRNTAEIQFEIFDPLVTPEVVNIIDSTPPSCAVDSLPAKTLVVSFPVSWTGSDAVGEIESYTVFSSQDGGAYTPFVNESGQTTAMFHGSAGKSYRFFCVAKDTAGNVEQQDLTSEAQTMIDVGANPFSQVGVFSDGSWFLDRSGDFSFDDDTELHNWGVAGNTPVAGDWNGDGIDDLGVFVNGFWFLDLNGDGVFDPASEAKGWGLAGWTPVVGDWNGDGSDEIGAISPESNWFRDINGDFLFDPATEVLGWGFPGVTPVVGDWNGDGADDVGVFALGYWFLDLDGDRAFYPALEARAWGIPGWTPLVGDWNGDGADEVGALSPESNWFRDINGDFVFDPATEVLGWGGSGDIPVVTDWNGDGIDDVGVFSSGFWFIDRNGDGAFDPATESEAWGAAGATPVPGKWR